METMGTDQLLDLFQLGAGQQPGPSQPVPDAGDVAQYEEEYDMGSFIKGLQATTR